MEVNDPVDGEHRRLLRQAVVEHVRSLTGRSVPPVLHVGRPGRGVRRFAIPRDEPTDHALRADVVAAMLGVRAGRTEPPWVWLGRGGDLALHDLDVAWLAAAGTAFAEAGADLTMVVVTRRGWRDPRSGAMQTWVRLRG
jgi:hypothetical protein